MNHEAITLDLCSVYSQTGHGGTEEIARICQEILGDKTTLVRRPSASIGCGDDLFFRRKGQGDKRLLLLGHYDTVPSANNRVPRHQGDKLLGLGTWDMKGGIALALHLFNFSNSSLFASLDLLLAGDEERRSSPFLSPGKYDAVLSFEGGQEGGPVISRFGAAVLEINLQGKALRAEQPLPQPGSIDALLFLHQKLALANSEGVHFSASRIEAKGAINVIPGQALLSGVLRYQSQEKRESYLEKINKEIKGFALEVSCSEVIPPLLASNQTKKICTDLGLEGVTRIGASDISWMKNSARLLFDGLGPFGGLDHTPDEYILPTSFATQAKMGQRLISKILG